MRIAYPNSALNSIILNPEFCQVLRSFHVDLNGAPPFQRQSLPSLVKSDREKFMKVHERIPRMKQ